MGDADRRSEFFTADGAATDSHEIRASGDDVIYIATRIDAVNFHCRRSRTNKELTCTRIRALGQRRDKEIPKTPRPRTRHSKIRALERRETTGRHEFTARRLAELSLGARHAGEDSSPLFKFRASGPRRTPCVKY